MIKAAVWIDRETELICAYVSLAGHDVVAAATSFSILAVAVEEQVLSQVPSVVSLEIGYMHVGCLGRPVDPRWLLQRLERM